MTTTNATKKGYKGRRPMTYTDFSDFERYYYDLIYKRICKKQMATSLNVSRPTLDKLLKEYSLND